MQYRLLSALLCALAFTNTQAVEKPHPIAAPATLPLNAASRPVMGLGTQIQSVTVSASTVALNAPTASVTVTVNSQGGPCATDLMINGMYSNTTIYTVDSNPSIGNALPYSGKLTFNGPGTYEVVARKSSWVGPGCSGEAKTTVVVTADPNWPCSIYSGYVKQSGGFLGPGQFMCAPANMPSNVAPMNCPNGTFFANLGAMFGCVTQGTINMLSKVAH